ncbi:RHS repeat-associated core domain-containing protein [Lysobacter sp. BMK333-48F3]|uniref:RHS repeat-associated core domain-containing protein n=1 Tax=Lysobacter sp. BMK333-48F3 TaxID=2867962 RepID=UPI001C8BC4D3|nr:RHS repeat-associated core domain-containing protein [Lysobacter sp. BMK333-48F3]MBX9402509.1 RHS repeat-associated core domain-containing protein [Lysobacter sp. BMK333-48F3]
MKLILNLIAAALLSFVPFGAKAETAVEYIHTDALGSLVAVTDVNQNVTERSEYEPYGRLLNPPGGDGPGYTGHVNDTATGLVYMQQRYYDSDIGRFLSIDPVGANSKTGGNFNRYWYANDNPYRFIDPDGRYVCTGDKGNCKRFDVAIGMAARAAVDPKLSSSQRAALSKAVAFYGKAGVENVKISFGSLKGDYANINTDRTGRGTVTFDLAAISGRDSARASGLVNGLAMRAVHEGDHGVRIVEKGFPSSRAERFEREQHGYRAEGYYQKATGYMQNGNNIWTPWGRAME